CHPTNLLVALPQQVPHRRWMVLNTLARQEKSLGRELLQRNVPFYLPLLPRQLDYRGRIVISYTPLFSGTVFCYGNDEERRICLETRRTTSIVDVADQSRLYSELRKIADVLGDDDRAKLPDSDWLSRRIRSPECKQSDLGLVSAP